MPLTEYQKTILKLLAKHRGPDSYVAGGTAINRAADTLRYSQDIDFFHLAVEAVQISAEKDEELLTRKGYSLDFALRQPGFIRAVVSKAQESVKLDWVIDSAFRFFPVIEDSEMGYRLHDVDLATNKCLALANRTELRDVLDLIQIDQTYLSLAATIWAACGKDPGFTPDLLLECLQRNSRITPDALAAESCAKPLDARDLKLNWTLLLGRTQSLLEALPAADLGCLYLNRKGDPVHTADPSALLTYTKHFGSVSGAWPRIV